MSHEAVLLTELSIWKSVSAERTIFGANLRPAASDAREKPPKGGRPPTRTATSEAAPKAIATTTVVVTTARATDRIHRARVT